MSTVDSSPMSDQSQASSRARTRKHSRASRTQRSSTQSGLLFISVLVVLALLVAGGWAVMNHKISLPGGLGTRSGNGTTLKVATAQPLNSLDMSKNTSTALDQALLHNVYDTVVGRDEHNNPAANGLAKKWSISQDGLQYTFTLHKGMKFSNGHTANADDVVASLKRTLETQTADSSRLARITQVNGNNLTVQITLSQPDPNLLWSLSTRAGIVYDSEASYDAQTSALGLGPYQVKKFDPGKSLTLTVNPHYGKAVKGYSTIELTSYPDAQAAVDALEAKKVDAVIPLANSPASAHMSDARQKLTKLENVTVATTSSTHRWGIALNTSADSLFSDTHIRQAYRAMLDQSALISTLGVNAAPLSGPIPSLDPGFEDLTNTYHYDVNQARQLLSYFGYARNFTLAYPQSYGDSFAHIVAGQLSALGGSITPQAIPDDQWQAQVVEGKNFDLALVDFAGSHDVSSIASPDYITQFTSPDMNNHLTAVENAKTDSEYATALSGLANQLALDTPVIWAYEEQPIVAAQAGITGLPTAMADSYVRLDDIIKK